MTENHLLVPFRNSYWVVPGRFLAGEHPSISHEDTIGVRLAALLTAGIRTFVDLTEEQELDSYQQMLRGLAEARQIDFT